MRQLGDLALVCAKRRDVALCIYNGEVCLYVGEGPNRRTLTAAWNDDDVITKLIRELNFGAYAERKVKLQ